MNKVKLRDVLDFGKKRIPYSKLKIETYVSTDNLLPNKIGVSPVSSLPASVGNVTKYEPSNILVSNIRPYLKKIYYSNREGGASSDVLTFVINKNYDPKFVYYNLFQDSFFNHMMAGSKGTKMPRGDKKQILEYTIPNFHIETQKRIAHVLSVLDDKIELNNKINAELEAMAKTLYDYWFVQFDFPNEEGKPYKSSGGKMVYNKILKREIPEGWEVRKLSQIANITMGQSPSGESFNVDSNGVIFFQGSTDFGWRYPDNRVYTTAPTRFAKENDILLSVRAPIGAMNLAMYDCCIGRGLAALNSKDNYNSFLIYQMNYFRRKFDYLNSVGTTFGSLSKEELQNLELVYPPENILEKFENIVAGLDAKIQLNTKQNLEISTLRDWLLPMLMNGQVKVEETYNIHEVSKYDIAAEPEPMFNASNI